MTLTLRLFTFVRAKPICFLWKVCVCVFHMCVLRRFINIIAICKCNCNCIVLYAQCIYWNVRNHLACLLKLNNTQFVFPFGWYNSKFSQVALNKKPKQYQSKSQKKRKKITMNRQSRICLLYMNLIPIKHVISIICIFPSRFFLLLNRSLLRTFSYQQNVHAPPNWALPIWNALFYRIDFFLCSFLLSIKSFKCV